MCDLLLHFTEVHILKKMQDTIYELKSLCKGSLSNTKYYSTGKCQNCPTPTVDKVLAAKYH